MNHNNKKKLCNFINLLLEREIAANQFRKPKYQPIKRIDEPEGGPLGNVLFSPYRSDGVDTTEPNTDLEYGIYKGVADHIIRNRDSELHKNINPILDLINQGKYDLLKPAPGYVYRAMTFDMSPDLKLEKFGLSLEDIKNNSANKPWIFEPNNLVIEHFGFMSWTYSLKELAKTSTIGLRKNIILIIIRAFVPNSGTFIINPNITKVIDTLNSFEKERETISYGNVSIDKMLVYYTEYTEEREEEIEIKKNEVENIFSYFSKSYMKNIMAIIKQTEVDIINYINNMPKFSNIPIKSFTELPKHNITTLSDLYVLVGKQHILNIIKNNGDKAIKLQQNYYDKIFKFLSQKIPHWNIEYESMLKKENLFGLEINYNNDDNKTENGLVLTFLTPKLLFGKKLNIKNFLRIIYDDKSFEDFHLTKKILFGMLQNEQ